MKRERSATILSWAPSLFEQVGGEPRSYALDRPAVSRAGDRDGLFVFSLALFLLALSFGRLGRNSEVAQQRADPVGHRNDVGVGLLEHVDLDAVMAVGAGQDLSLTMRPR